MAHVEIFAAGSTAEDDRMEAGRGYRWTLMENFSLKPTATERSSMHSAYVRGSELIKMISAAAPTFNPHVMRQMDSRPVVRSPEQLRLHRALDEVGWTGIIDDLNDAARLKNHSLPEPILITMNGTILAGFERWRLALFEGRREIHCIEYPFSDDESLSFILIHHRPRRGWNAFVRIRLALTLEPYLQQQALDNMRTGGKYKGLANLPDVQRIDLRQEIASAAAVGLRNVSNVKTILKIAHPRLIAAFETAF